MNKSEIKTLDWAKELDSNFRNIGTIVMHGNTFYSYDDDCWRYAPDLYKEFVIDAPRADLITEENARKIVEKEGGNNFDKLAEVLYKTDKDGKYSALN